MAAVRPHLRLSPGTLWGVRMCSPGQKLLWLFDKVAGASGGLFRFFFLLQFIEVIMVKCQTFLNAWKELFSGS